MIPLALLVASGCLASWAAGRYPIVAESRRWQAFLALWCLGVGAWFAWSCTEAGIFGHLLVTLCGLFIAFIWAYYWVSALGQDLIVHLPRWWMGDHKLRMPVSFDAGDAAMKAGDPAKALALYRKESFRAPDHPDLHLRMAEAHRALGDPGQAMGCERKAARAAADPDRRGPILLALSEHLQQAGEAAAARQVLEEVLGEAGLQAYHAPARARLGILG